MKKFFMMATIAFALCACGNNADRVDSTPVATDSICSSVATAVVPAAATEVLPAAAPGDSGKVATEVVPAE